MAAGATKTDDKVKEIRKKIEQKKMFSREPELYQLLLDMLDALVERDNQVP